MSATNTGAVRRVNDNYETPIWLTEALMPALSRRLEGLCNGRQPRFLEPASGNGAIVRVLRGHFPKAAIDTGDIRTGQDLLRHPYQPIHDTVVTNPRFSLALEFCQRALELRRTPQSCVAMLLRLNFLGGQKRAPWWREHAAGVSIYVTPRRPSFTGGATDATEYAWFLWGGGTPAIEILKTETIEKRVDSSPKSR